MSKRQAIWLGSARNSREAGGRGLSRAVTNVQLLRNGYLVLLWNFKIRPLPSSHTMTAFERSYIGLEIGKEVGAEALEKATGQTIRAIQLLESAAQPLASGVMARSAIGLSRSRPSLGRRRRCRHLSRIRLHSETRCALSRRLGRANGWWSARRLVRVR